MTQFVPVNLSGNNLGERHRHLNSLVRDAFHSSAPFESIQDIPETSLVVRLFKIDLASKYRNVDFIIKNLKDADMLFVSRALKSTWLLESEYKHIINADYLESELFQEMTSTAVNKMLHWIQHNLRVPERCKDFYMFYKEKEIKIAIKFLWHCSNVFLLEEFENILDRIDAFNLKVLSERCPQLTKIFYGNLETNRNVLKRYLDDEKSFFYNLKFVLKSDPDTFFKVTEQYFNINTFNAYGPDITKHIMINHRNKFFCKAELYTAWLLDINTLAKFLSQEEVRDVVLKLARAEYLSNWFTYQNVEPLIKMLEKNERAAFKKLVFVDEVFGDKIKDWPYTPPSPPVIKEIPGYSLFMDKHYTYSFIQNTHCKRKVTKRCIKRSRKDQTIISSTYVRRTLLDDLFDRYRFKGFDATLSELRKRLRTESNMQNREYMMFVLISKTGGREDCLRTLLGLLSQYRNELVHFRAAIVRSLVNRAFVWRLPDDLWANLLEWAHGMGLDGEPSEIECTEGLHAVVLRNLLTNPSFGPVVSKFFLDNFTDFTQYSLNTTERSLLRTSLPKLLLDAAISGTALEKETRLEQLLNILDEYKIAFDKFPGVIEAIATAVQEGLDSSEWLLTRLFNARIARKYFFKENFSRVLNNASHINALRHDISVINVDRFKEIMEYVSPSTYEQYFRKLVVYFAEPSGLAEQNYTYFKRLAEIEPHKCLAKPLSLLAGKEFSLCLKTLDAFPKKSAERSLAAALRANAHNARPRIALNTFGWQAAGVKLIANMVSVSPRNKREEYVKELIAWGRSTIRLALALTENEEAKCSAYKKIVELRPGAALKIFLQDLKRGYFGSEFEIIWNTLKPVITQLDYSKRRRLSKNMENVKVVPASIKSEYYVLVYQVFMKIDKCKELRMLGHIENICNEIDEEFFTSVVKAILENELLKDDYILNEKDDDYIQELNLYVRLTAKFLLLCDSEESQRVRIDLVEKSFLQRFEGYWKRFEDKNILTTILEIFLEALKYNKVFLNAKYVSCMPVFEKVLAWLHSILSIEKWFDVYIKLHLTMLYYKAARICISQKPEFFTDDPNNLDKGIDMFGTIFGKFIARDYEELQGKYFQSIREIYREEIIGYCVTFIDYTTFDYSKERFVATVIKSMLLEEETREAHFVASYVFEYHKKCYFKYGYDLSCIQNILAETKNDDLRFCLNLNFHETSHNYILQNDCHHGLPQYLRRVRHEPCGRRPKRVIRRRTHREEEIPMSSKHFARSDN